MRISWLTLLAAFVGCLGIWSAADVASAQVGCGRFGCYTKGGGYGGIPSARPRFTTERRAKNWRAAARERQRAARIAARISERERLRGIAAAAAAKRAAAAKSSAAAAAAAAALPRVPVTELDVSKVPALGADGVRRIQQALKNKGFDPGPVNGVATPRMKEAVSSFQTRFGIASNGEVDNQTLLALGEADLASQVNR